MAVPEGKTRVQVTLDDDVLEILDFVAAEAGITRSKLIENFVEVSIDQVGMVAALGMSPRRARLLSDIVDGHPLLARFLSPLDETQKNRSKAKKRLGIDSKKEKSK